MKPTTKGQAEIIGLVLIVFLLSLGMLFTIRFMGTSKVSTRTGFTQAKITSGILGSILDTSSGCKQTRIRTLLQDCAVWYSTGGSISCGLQDSCAYVESAIEYMLNNTLKTWHLKYDFRVYIDVTEPLFNITNVGCQFEKESEKIPIPTDAGTLWAKLDIC